MPENRVTEFFNKMSAKDFKRFREFLQSPYHNKNNDVIVLFDRLKKSFEKKINSYEPDSLSAVLNFTPRKINFLISELRKLLGDFILAESLSKNPIEKKINQLTSFNEKHVFNNSKHVLSDIKKMLAGQQHVSPENYFHNFIADYTDKATRFADLIYSPNTELKELSYKLSMYFICYKLIIYGLMVRQKIETAFDVKYDFSFKSKIEEFISSNRKEMQKNHPLIYAYYLGMKMNDEKNNDKNFYSYKRFILLNRKKFSRKIFEGLMMELMNNCSDRMEENREKYIRETFDVYKILDENRVYSSQFFISDINFMNAVLTALELKNPAWANYFFKKYKDILDPINKDDILHLVMANISFYKNDYNKSLAELNLINTKKFYFYLRIRVLRIKIYYELKEYEAVSYLVDTVKHYIKRNKPLIGTNFEVVNSFLNYLKKIIRFKISEDSKGLAEIKKLIIADNITAAKSWLIEKLKEY